MKLATLPSFTVFTFISLISPVLVQFLNIQEAKATVVVRVRGSETNASRFARGLPPLPPLPVTKAKARAREKEGMGTFIARQNPDKPTKPKPKPSSNPPKSCQRMCCENTFSDDFPDLKALEGIDPDRGKGLITGQNCSNLNGKFGDTCPDDAHEVCCRHVYLDGTIATGCRLKRDKGMGMVM